MALPSQMPRVSRQASFRRDPQRGGRVPGAMVVSSVVVAAALGSWWWLGRDGGSPASAKADQPPRPSVLATNEPINLALSDPKGPSVPALERTIPVVPADSAASGTQTRASSDVGRGIMPPTGTVQTPPEQKPDSPPQPTATRTGGGWVPPTSVQKPEPSSAAPAVTTPPDSLAADARDPVIQRYIASAEASIAAARLAEARVALNRALHDPRASDADEAWLRRKLTELNDTLLFSAAVAPGDPLCETYTIQAGDRLITIVKANDLKVDWRFIQRINKMSDPGRLRVGQKLKIARGPFHAVVEKSAHRLDLYADMTDPDGNRLFIRSFTVGLGEGGSTPIGKWAVRSGSKLINPPWINPRTGERFAADDPKNPIGEHWLGIVGIEPRTEVLSGYGLHGTIEPESIGRDASMGCVRMLPDDIALIYEMLVEQFATVEIRP